MKGSEGKSQHNGLHTLYGLKAGTDYLIEKDDDESPKKVFAFTCGYVYSAKVKLKTGVSKRGDSEWEKEFKLSTFFPDTMTLTHIIEATTKAWLFYQGVTQKPKGNEAALNSIETIASGSTKWAGRVTLQFNRQDHTIWVGSLQEGTTGSKLYNSFPTLGAPNFT